MRIHRSLTLLVTGVLLAAAVVTMSSAQESATYRLSEHVFNAGGHPDSGSTPASATYRITLGAIGDSAVGVALSSASYGMDGGFTSTYVPPGEVLGLRFLADDLTLEWDPEHSVGSYNLYRDAIASLPGGYGACRTGSIGSTTTTDAETPLGGTGWYYLVTAENRIAEEGTKGVDGSGSERPNGAPCP